MSKEEHDTISISAPSVVAVALFFSYTASTENSIKQSGHDLFRMWHELVFEWAEQIVDITRPLDGQLY